MDDKLVYIFNNDNKVTRSVDENYWLKILDTFQQIKIKYPKYLIQLIKITDYNSLGTSIIQSLMSPCSTWFN